MGRYDNAINTLRKDRDDLVSAVNAKGQNAPANTKISEIPSFISAIVTKTGGEVKLVVTAPDYEGQTITATCGSERLTETVFDGTCEIYVTKAGVWTVSAEDGTNTEVEVVIDVPVELSGSGSKFTVRIKKAESDPEKRVEYMDDAEGMTPVTMNPDGTANLGKWAKSFFFDKIRPCMLKTNGTVDYYLDPENQTQKLEGGSSSISDINYDGNAMVEIEKMYSRFWEDGTYEYISISKEEEDNYQPIGFVRDDGSVADRVFTAMFLGTVNSNKLRSIGNQSIKFADKNNNVSKNFKARTTATANGSNYSLRTYSIYQLLNALFLILFKNDNATKALGTGRSGTGRKNNADAPTLSSGIKISAGPITYDSSSKCVKFMWIEDFFSDTTNPLYEAIDGLLVIHPSTAVGNFYVKMNGPYSETSTSGYTAMTNSNMVTKAGYIKESTCNNNYGRFPSVIGASTTTYQTDSVRVKEDDADDKSSPSTRVASRAGGLWGISNSLLEWAPYYHAYSSLCSALMYIPPAD